MTTKLIVIFLFTANISFAQFKPQPTQFDKFVKHSKIEWAAYASDTFNFTNAGLNNLLLNRLVKKQIKASFPVDSRSEEANKIQYAVIDSIDKVFFPEEEMFMSDTLGNIARYVTIRKQIDSTTFTVTEVTQILYVENGTLKSYIPWVTPTLPVFTSTGNYIGERFYFNTAYNYKPNYKFPKKNKLSFLAQTKKMIKLNHAQERDALKEMYGRNVLETLWPFVMKNEIEAFSVEQDSNRKLKPEQLTMSLAAKQPVITPIYDLEGKIVSYIAAEDPINPKIFTHAQLIQDWYYDYKKNKFFSNIKAMVLYLNKLNDPEDKKPVPVLKLVFK